MRVTPGEATCAPTPRGHDMATEPAFDMQAIESGLTDSYWIQAVDVDSDGRPDTLTSGMSDGRVSRCRKPDGQKHHYVPGYFRCEEPQLTLPLNRYGTPVPGAPVIPSLPLGE
jgi:hypothetical protein